MIAACYAWLTLQILSPKVIYWWLEVYTVVHKERELYCEDPLHPRSIHPARYHGLFIVSNIGNTWAQCASAL